MAGDGYHVKYPVFKIEYLSSLHTNPIPFPDQFWKH